MPDLKDLARDLRGFVRDMERAADRANRRIGEIALEEARKRSTGAFSTVILSEAPPGLNHPYGVGPFNSRGDRGPLPYGDESIVNRQTGRFYRAWHLDAMPVRVPTLLLNNDAPYAKWLEIGTPDAIARPIDVRVREAIARVGPKIAEEEFSRAWRVRFDTK